MIKKETIGAKPFYLPGDIVTSIHGDKGVIVEAHVIVNGMEFEWNGDEEIPAFEHGSRPAYAITWFANSQGGTDCTENKCAWWESHEWADVELGLVHKIQRGEQ
jgi:hypothetical protein